MIEEKGFKEYLESEKRYSAHTVKAYLADLKQFSVYLADTYEVSDAREASSPMIRSWVSELMDAGVSARSVNRKLSTLKTFFKYLMREGEVKKNPMVKVGSPKTESRLPSYMEQKDMEDLLRPDMFTDGFAGVRDRLMIMLLYYTGMRRSELIELPIHAYDALNGQVKVVGKGNKERIIPINNEMKDLIDSYLKLREEEGLGKNAATLLITDKGKALYPNFVYRTVKDHLARVSSSNKRSPHVLRHTFATHLLNNGADLNAIKEILGHANLSATQVYTHNSIEKLKQIYNQAHPKA